MIIAGKPVVEPERRLSKMGNRSLSSTDRLPVRLHRRSRFPFRQFRRFLGAMVNLAGQQGIRHRHH